MNSRALKLSVLGGTAAAVVIAGFLIRNRTDPPAGRRTVSVATPASTEIEQATIPGKRIEVIDKFHEDLRKRQVTPSQLLSFRDALLQGDPATTIPLIRAFLATGKDVTTGLPFELGEGGSLDRAPTLRLLLLDVLGQLSRKARTADAAAVSREILSEKKSSDEWAIALRNVAWHEPQSRAYLASKFSEMSRYEPWRAQPSSGFLEAFDVAVFSGQPAVMEPLNDVLQQPSPELQRAAAVALDRLAEAEPLEVMLKLNSQPQMFADYPFLRADWFAKADLGEPAQRAAFEAYLSRPDVTLAEKTKALKALASPGQFLSDNLLTSKPLPVDDSARDAAILNASKDWSQRFPGLSAPVANLRERLRP